MKKYFMRSTPEAQGMSAMNIQQFLEALDRQNYPIHSFLLLRHGKVVAEATKYPVLPDDKRLVYSLSKTFTATAVGIAIKNGLLNLDEKIIKFFPEYTSILSDKKIGRITIKHLLTMSAGHSYDSIGTMCNGDDDWVRTYFSQTFTYEPGEKFVYDSGGTYMLSEIISRVTGMSLFDYLQEHLFRPLHITDVSWDVHGKVTTGAWGLLISPEDIAKLGMLYLQNGMFEGQRIISEEWVQDASREHIATDRNSPDGWSRGYGYHIWKNNADSYRADGAFGQFCMVFPKEDMVIVTTSEELNPERMFPLIEQYLLKNLSDAPCAMNADLNGALQKYIMAWETPAIFPPTFSHLESDLPNRKYKVTGADKTDYTLSFQWCNSHMEICINDLQTIKSSNVTFEYGETPYALMPPSVSPILGEPQCSRSWLYSAHHEWVNSGTLLLTICYRETGHRQQWTFIFSEDTLEIIISNSCKRFFELSPLKSDKNMDFGDLRLQGTDISQK